MHLYDYLKLVIAKKINAFDNVYVILKIPALKASYAKLCPCHEIIMRQLFFVEHNTTDFCHSWNLIHHSSDVTWASWRPKLAARIIVQNYIQANAKNSTKLCFTGPMLGESTGDRWILSTRSQ